MVTATNYNAVIASGVTRIGCGKALGDAGILFCGDSNMCGDGGGVDTSLDRPSNDVFHWTKTSPYIDEIHRVNANSAPYLDHSLNSLKNEVGPDLPFLDRFGAERGDRRIVGLPAGDSGSGFSTAQWFSGQEMYALAVSLVNNFLAANVDNSIEAIVIELGANDVLDFTTAIWQGHLDNLITEFRSTAFTGNAAQPSFAAVPVVVIGLPPDWYTGVIARQEIQDVIEGTPNRFSKCGYASTAGLASQSGDSIHLSGASNRILGSTNMWTAFLAAETDT